MRSLDIIVVLWVMSVCHITTSICDELDHEDAKFCSGGLKVTYPDRVIDGCAIIPQEFREKISKVWGPPQVQLTGVNENRKYTLLMVDPDAPSLMNPSLANWRHWVIVGIKGSGLVRGDIRGDELSAYQPPTPPHGTGLHRYQFLVFEQPDGQTLSLTPKEKSSLGNWDPKPFVQRFGLTGPVAALQFLTQNHKD
ncbi:phosphatidylethanolamine-binding protein 4 isoform X1 [Misgurnus anguillicaudatus]|uniref:phosphatidylethanolamine-binding protein 4 isoform X1 n=1 Tax=Misgurnus anguillicaudatus TaxID=75329 RepID=UPI003CCF5510